MVEVVYERCCGLDIHKQTVVACLLVPGPSSTAQKEIRTFGTMTDDLLQLGDWLSAAGCTHVAMESTGVYWKPIYNLLESSFELWLVNARHIKQVPGRKTDVRDCEWIADLLRHGLLRGSFVPDRPQRELRELTRYRTSLIRERAAEVNRVQKTLEGANIKLSSVATDVLGVSGRQMLAALVSGTHDPAHLADLAHGKLRVKAAAARTSAAWPSRRASAVHAGAATGAPGCPGRADRTTECGGGRAGTPFRGGRGAPGRDSRRGLADR
jgi:transposase